MPLGTEVAFTCPACFEAGYAGVDPAGGRRQRFVEDCAVCCRPVVFDVAFDRDGEPRVVSAELES